ncbi:MAG: Yip1 family protein [Methanospirillum sp.]
MNNIEQDRPAPDETVPTDVPAPVSGELPVEPVPMTSPRAEARRPSLVELFTNPRGFFEALEGQPVDLRMPALIVLAVGIVAAIAAYLVSSVLMGAIAIQGAEGLGGVIGIIGAIAALIFTLLSWVIYTAVFFVISMAFHGRGDFNRLLSYVGYGHLPQVIGGIISLLLSWSYLSTLRVPALTTPQAITEWTLTITKGPTMQLSIVVGLLFLLWSANLWIFGVHSGRKLSLRDAAITVGVPLLIYIIYTVFSLVA